MKKLIIISTFFLSFTFTVKAQNAKIQSMFIYNFIKLIEWPADYKTGDFVIGVIGNGDINTELNNIAAVKKAGSQTIKVTKFANGGAITKCNILFITSGSNGQLAGAVAKLTGKGTLIITEKEGAAKNGSCINFVIRNNKQAFELNPNNMTSHNLKTSSQLTNLAIVVK